MIHRIHRFSRLCYLIAAGLLVSGCTGLTLAGSHGAAAPEGAAGPVPSNTIVIDNFTFSPQTLTVSAGTTLTWINRDDVPHTVTSSAAPRTLDSPALDTGDRYQVTFRSPGIYAYYCAVHPHMTGTITVQ